jgi:hypothetical protein
MNVHSRNVSLRLGLLAAVALLAAMNRPAAVRAAAPVASLDIVPADAAFYSATLRNREQFDLIANSKAWAKVKALPAYQMGLTMYQMQAGNPGTPAGWIQAALDNPESRKSLEFFADLVSDEVFVYGGPSINKTVELYQNTYWASQLASVPAAMQAAAQGPTALSKMEDARSRAAIQALVSDLDLIEVPELVIGMKVKDKTHAEQLLDRLEGNLQQVFAANPMFEGRFKRAKVAGHSYLTLALDGGMIPWDAEIQERIRSMAPTPADGDKLIERLKKLKLVISLGLRDEFLLVAIGPSTDVLTRLGGATPLRSREELAAVGKFAEKPIVSVSYSSKTFNEHFSPTKADIDQLAATAKGLLPELPVPANLRDSLAKSTDELAADLKSLTTEIGATASVGFLTKSGYESFAYDWSDHPEIDCSKPLDILKHVGGNPIAVIAGRSKVSPAGYDMLVKWLRTAYHYGDEYGAPQMPPKERRQFNDLMEQVKPLVARLDKATRDSLLPALADGQTALVIDAKLTSRQFIKTLPATEQPLPMLEPAIVIGVSDAAKLKAAFAEYYAAADEFVEAIKVIDQKDEKHDIPKDFKIPRPKEFNLRQGHVYGYALPAEAGVDSRVLPNAGLSENVAVLSISGRHTQRLLGESDPVMAGIKLPTTRPYGSVAAFDFGVLLDAVSPWVDLALEKGTAQASPQDAEMTRLHAKTALEVLRCYRGTVAVTFKEGKAIVTRSRSEFHDIEE